MGRFIEMSPDHAFLVVDDGPTFREAISNALKTLGYRRVFQAVDGPVALQMLKSEQINFIICERNLRQMSGMELLKEIRETPECARVPFMMMASDIPKEDVFLASEFGVDGYLKKPFMLKDVSTRISACMARYLDAANPEAVFDEAREAFMKGRYKESLAVYGKLQEQLPKSARVKVGMARAHRALDKLDQAEKTLQEAIAVNPMYVHAHNDLGLVYLQLGNMDAALRCFDEAIRLSPSNPVRYEQLGDILMRAERYAEAEDYLIRATKLELVYPLLYAQLGKALFSQKKLDKAAKFFEKALKQQPDNTSFLNSMGICMKDLGKYDESLAYYNQALKYRPQDTKVLFNKALCLMQMKELDRARKICDAIIKIDPAYEKAHAKMREIDKLLAAAGRGSDKNSAA